MRARSSPSLLLLHLHAVRIVSKLRTMSWRWCRNVRLLELFLLPTELHLRHSSWLLVHRKSVVPDIFLVVRAGFVQRFTTTAHTV